MTYVQDRNALRSLTHKLPPHAGKATLRTFVYALISHMRNKLHMRYWRTYYGGWRYGFKSDRALLVQPKFYKIYGKELGEAFFHGCCIHSLEDQAAWIKMQMRDLRDLSTEPDLRDLAQRVLDKTWEEPVRKIA